jgi:putative transposase
MGLALERKSGKAEVSSRRRSQTAATRIEAEDNGMVLPELKLAAMLRCRVRYFTDGAMIGSKAFVNEGFAEARERFTAKRKDGARRLRGNGKAAAGVLWSMRDLRVRV